MKNKKKLKMNKGGKVKPNTLSIDNTRLNSPVFNNLPMLTPEQYQHYNLLLDRTKNSFNQSYIPNAYSDNEIVNYVLNPQDTSTIGLGRYDYPEEKKSGGWIKDAINPAHKGYCTPMTKSTCTPHRKAFAKRAKAHFKEDGGALYDIKAPYIYSYEEGGYIPMAKNGIQNPNLFQGINYQQPNGALNYSQTLGFQDIGNPYQQYQINKPLQRGNISIPEIQGATNFKQEIQTPEIHPYDFYNPQTGELTKQKQEKKQSSNSFSPIIPDMFSTNPYLAKANYYRKQAINSFSNIGNNSQIPQNQGLIGSKYGGKMENGGSFNNIFSGVSNAVLADVNTAKGFTDIFGGLQMSSAVANIENLPKKQNLISQYENNQPVISGGWGGFQPLEGTYVPVGAKYGTSIPKAEYGIPSKFTGARHYENSEEGIPINTSINATNANDMKVPVEHADLLVEGGGKGKEGEYFIPAMKQGGKNQGAHILSDRKNVGWNGKSPSENYDEMTKEVYGITANKFNKGIAKTEKFVTDNLKFIDPKYNENSQKATEALTIPIMKGTEDKLGMNDLAQIAKIKQEQIKKSKGMDNDLDSIMQSNQQPMAQYGAQIPDDMNYYDTSKMFMKNGGYLPQAGGGKGIDNDPSLRGRKNIGIVNYKDLDEGYKDYKRKGYTGAKDITKMREWAYQKDKVGTDNYILNTLPTAEHERIWRENYSKTEPIDLMKMTDKERFAGYNEGLWDFRLHKPELQQNLQTSTLKAKEVAPSSERTKVDFKSNLGKTSQTGFNPSSINFNIPNVYTKKPITSYNIAPQFVNPEVISPYVNDIQRLQYANTANLGYSGAELANRANMFGQGLSEYGKRYLDASQFNAQQRGRASEQNVQTALNTASSNRQNQWQTESAQNQRDAAIQQQMLLDQNPYLKMLGDKEHEQRVGELSKQIYDPRYTDYMNYVNPSLAQKPEGIDETTYKIINGQYVPVSAKDKNKKLGGKINTKKFKSKKK